MIKAIWTNEDLRFIGTDMDKHGIVLDSQDGYGPKPMQLLLMSLIGCTGMDAISIMQKKRQIPEHFEVVIEEIERAENHPKVYTYLKIAYIFEGDVKKEACIRSVELSQKKYCSVSAMLRKTARLEYRVLLNGEEIYVGE